MQICLYSVEVGRLGSRLHLFTRGGVYRPYWDAVVLRLAALEPASLLAQLSVEQLGVLAGIVGLHRFLNTFFKMKREPQIIKNTNLPNGCSLSI
jgi:hypothetical protein